MNLKLYLERIKKDKPLLLFLFLSVIVDGITTLLNGPNFEGNPLIQPVLMVNPILIVPVKLAISAVIVIGYFRIHNWKKFIADGILWGSIIAYFLVTINNLIVLFAGRF
ncbi:hypothetical protein HYV84_04355 [Candidatus Woesearchaeota archaeon]|nr:hypothetical protein [Candidatus Woesearchaeota archaeon]